MQWENKINVKFVIPVTSEGDLSDKQLQNIEKKRLSMYLMWPMHFSWDLNNWDLIRWLVAGWQDSFVIDAWLKATKSAIQAFTKVSCCESEFSI